MSFPRYPEYKDSGVEWLGTVPGHWNVERLRRTISVPLSNGLFKKKEEFGCGALLINVFDIYREDFKVNFDSLERVKCDDSELSNYEVLPEDLFFVRSSLKQEGIAVVAMAESCSEAVVFECHLIRARPNREVLSGRFASYVMNSTVYRSTMIAKAKITTMTTIDQEAILSTCLPVPPLPEQTQIASFLDRETAKIDALVAEQRRLMALLKEKRQAVISHAVTRGLNPDAPMKPSGIKWLGDVPKHWVQSRIKYSLRGLIDTEHKTAPFFDDGEYLVVRTTNIKDGKLILDGGKYTNLDGYEEWTRRGKPVSGDLMFTREAPAGEACLVPEDVQLCMGQRTVLMQIDHDALDSRFALWSLYGGLASEFITILSQGSTVAHFNMSDISNIPIMLPSVGEQKEVAEFLESELAKFDTLTTEAQRAIDLLQERRMALISAAVTGQIDVRGLLQ